MIDDDDKRDQSDEGNPSEDALDALLEETDDDAEDKALGAPEEEEKWE